MSASETVPDICPRCHLALENNVVLVTDPQGNKSARCCTPKCGWRDDEPNQLAAPPVGNDDS